MEAYGTYFSLFGFSVVFSFLLDWGMTAFFNRQLAAQKESFINQYGKFLFIKLLFAVLYIIVVCIAAWLSGIKRWNIISAVIAVQVLTSFFLFFRSIITANQWFGTDAWLSVLDKLLMILLCGSLLYFPSEFGSISIGKFLVIQIICSSLALLCALAILLRQGINFSVNPQWQFSRQLFKSALPFAVIILLMSLHYRLDGFLLERLHPNGAYEAGVYASAYRLLDAANMIGYLVASFLLPLLARLWSEGKNISEPVLRSRHLLVVFSLAIAILVFFMAPWIQKMLYHNSNTQAIEILQWCLPALIGYSLVQVYGTLLTATGHITGFCYITTISVAINIITNLLLIPAMGAKGCCIAALVSQHFCGIVSMWYASEKSGITVDFRSLLIYFFIAILLVGFFYFTRDLSLNKWLLIAGAVLITFSAALAAKLFTFHSWIRLLKEYKH